MKRYDLLYAPCRLLPIHWFLLLAAYCLYDLLHLLAKFSQFHQRDTPCPQLSERAEYDWQAARVRPGREGLKKMRGIRVDATCFANIQDP